MSDTQTKGETGAPKLLAEYDCAPADRTARRRRGPDHRPPPGRTGYLVDEGFGSMAELEALVADYLEKARRLGYAPMQGWF